jgi:hypothetical protein
MSRKLLAVMPPPCKAKIFWQGGLEHPMLRTAAQGATRSERRRRDSRRGNMVEEKGCARRAGRGGGAWEWCVSVCVRVANVRDANNARFASRKTSESLF